MNEHVALDQLPDALDSNNETGVATGSRRHRDVLGWIASGWLVAIVLAATVADVLPLEPNKPDYRAINVRPFRELRYLLGTDGIGRDLVARVVFGARTSLLLSLVAVMIGFAIGSVAGVTARYFGGLYDRITSFLCDIYLAFPGIVAIMAGAAIFGNTAMTLAVILGVGAAPGFVRLARGNAGQYVVADFVLAAQSYGASNRRIIFSSIFPNLVRPLLAYACLYMGVLIVTEGVLGYLGLGVPAPTASWGGMIAQGRVRLLEDPHVWIVPSVFLVFTILAINYLSDRMSRSLSPGSELYAL